MKTVIFKSCSCEDFVLVGYMITVVIKVVCAWKIGTKNSTFALPALGASRVAVTSPKCLHRYHTTLGECRDTCLVIWRRSRGPCASSESPARSQGEEERISK